jgi:hypothetical protein
LRIRQSMRSRFYFLRYKRLNSLFLEHFGQWCDFLIGQVSTPLHKGERDLVV